MKKNINNYWIYKITSPNNKVYIGITTNIIKRFNIYKNKKCTGQPAIHNTIKKYGWDILKKEILFTFLSWEEACKKEIELISWYKDNKTSLNIANGGTNFINPSREENKRCKKVIQFNLDGDFIKEWVSLIDINESLKFNNSNIGRSCREKTFYAHGFLWCFKKDYELGIIPIFTNKIGKNKCIKIQKLDINKNLLFTYSSIKEAVKDYNGTNPRINITNSLNTNKPDYKNNYYEYIRKGTVA